MQDEHIRTIATKRLTYTKKIPEKTDVRVLLMSYAGLLFPEPTEDLLALARANAVSVTPTTPPTAGNPIPALTECELSGIIHGAGSPDMTAEHTWCLPFRSWNLSLPADLCATFPDKLCQSYTIKVRKKSWFVLRLYSTFTPKPPFNEGFWGGYLSTDACFLSPTGRLAIRSFKAEILEGMFGLLEKRGIQHTKISLITPKKKIPFFQFEIFGEKNLEGIREILRGCVDMSKYSPTLRKLMGVETACQE